MSDALDIAELRVQLHEERQHDALEARISELMGLVDQACAEARGLAEAHAEHLASYHAPEPESEAEPEAETEPAEEVPPAEPAAEPEPAEEPEAVPVSRHPLVRRIGQNND